MATGGNMKIWFCYLRTGGGHKAPAEALERAFLKLGLGVIETRMIDMAERVEIFFRAILEKGYIFLTQHAEFLYKVLYNQSKNKGIIGLEFKLADFVFKPSLKARLISDPPDAIVVTHFLVSPLRKAIRELKLNIPLVVVVTEPFSAPPIWFNHKDLTYVVFSEQAKEAALKEGVSSENVLRFPQLANHEVSHLTPEQVKDVKSRYGFDPNQKMVLLIGGGNGLPGGHEVMKQVVKLCPDTQVAVVAGENLKYEKMMRKVSEKHRNVKVFGFIDYISDLIGAADIIVTKAGAGVVWESVLHHKPLLITHYIYGQEKGTMEFVVNSGLGWYEPKPSHAAKKLREFLVNSDLHDQVAAKYKEYDFRAGNDEIARAVYRFISK